MEGGRTAAGPGVRAQALLRLSEILKGFGRWRNRWPNPVTSHQIGQVAPGGRLPPGDVVCTSMAEEAAVRSGSRLGKLALLMGVFGFVGSVAGAFGALALAIAASTLGAPAILSVAVLRHGLPAGWLLPSLALLALAAGLLAVARRRWTVLLLHAAAQQGYLVASRRWGPLELPWGTVVAPLLTAVALAALALAAVAVFERLWGDGKGFGT
jgi:hypothetical protein